MRLEIRSQDLVVGEEWRGYIDRRLRFVLGRFGNRIGCVKACLADLNGPRGGMDKRCRIVVHLPRSGVVIVEDTDGDIGSVVDRAADRAGQAVRRELERRRERGGHRAVSRDDRAS
ncbi:MAG: HPF/RaiA family ribosome-associated protein [Planctomycetia bacterium]|nr:HPF/RaiA family ribosome-associated protein [Planctomycetia bacterium]